MNRYNNRLWNKPFKIRRSVRTVEPDQVIENRYGVLIKLPTLDNFVLYIMPSESF